MRRTAFFRTLLGFLIAPISPGLLLAVGTLFTGKIGEGVWGIGFAALLGYPAALILGVPIYFFFNRRGWVSIWPYIAVGLFLGAAMYLVFIPPVSFTNGTFGID